MKLDKLGIIVYYICYEVRHFNKFVMKIDKLGISVYHVQPRIQDYICTGGGMARQRHPSRLREAGGSMRGDVAPSFVGRNF